MLPASPEPTISPPLKEEGANVYPEEKASTEQDTGNEAKGMVKEKAQVEADQVEKESLSCNRGPSSVEEVDSFDQESISCREFDVEDNPEEPHVCDRWEGRCEVKGKGKGYVTG